MMITMMIASEIQVMREGKTIVRLNANVMSSVVSSPTTNPQLQSVYVTVMEMIDRLRRRQNIDVYFVDEAAPGHGNADSDQFPAIEGGALMGMSRAEPFPMRIQ